MNREQAWILSPIYGQRPLRKHMLSVEAAMRAYAQ
jgi:predicted hydrolase (HD superfamily)